MGMLYWYVRCYCNSCNNYIWTESANENVVCICSGAEIKNSSILRGSTQIDESLFNSQVKDAHAGEDIIVSQYNG